VLLGYEHVFDLFGVVEDDETLARETERDDVAVALADLGQIL
jgi:hypothetical protein